MNKILIDKKGKKLLWKCGDLHTLYGVIKEEDILNSKDGKVFSHTKKEFTIFDASFSDLTKKMKKGAATSHPKDIGQIIITTGINSDSKIVDAGAGTGLLAANLTNISPNTTTYEKNEEFYKNAKKNLENLKLKTIIKNKDITQGISEKNLDLITLDLKDPSEVLPHAESSLKSGGYLVCYLPHTTQITTLIKSSEKYSFYHEKTVEILEREWTIEPPRSRPKNQMLGHTAFLTFLRKY